MGRGRVRSGKGFQEPGSRTLLSGEEERINQRACQVQGFCISSSGAGGRMGRRGAGCQPELAVQGGGCNEGGKKSVMGGEEEQRWLCFKQETTQFTAQGKDSEADERGDRKGAEVRRGAVPAAGKGAECCGEARRDAGTAISYSSLGRNKILCRKREGGKKTGALEIPEVCAEQPSALRGGGLS